MTSKNISIHNSRKTLENRERQRVWDKPKS